ncbi:PKD domain-containing protein [Chitinophagaceae bacterium LWZ2-11]
MKNLCLWVAVLFMGLLSTKANSQTLSVDNSTFVTGTYGQGSNIAIPISVSGSYNAGNTFQVYLSDASGNFGSPTLIGSYSNYFATFVNGTIPAGTPPGSGYKIMIKSTSPALSSTTSAFTISAATAPVAQIDPVDPNRILQTQFAYGWCSKVAPQTNFILKDNSTGATTVTGILKDELTGVVQTGLAFASVGGYLTTNPNATYYTFIETAANSAGVISTKAYYIINDYNKLPISTVGDQSTCIPSSIQYQIPTDNINGIGNNFPLTMYQVDWGDGVVQILRQCDLIAALGNITHSYSALSCSQPNITYNITITLLNPWFSTNGTQTQQNCEQPQVLSHAKIFKTPNASYTSNASKQACVQTPFTFLNNSDPGAAQFGSQCTTSASYYWYVNGALIQVNPANPADLTKPNFTYTFPTVGKYEVKLVVDNGSCQVSTFIDSICVDAKPAPDFKMNGKDTVVVCAPATIVLTNNSNTGYCQNMVYSWAVTDTLGNVIAPGTSTSGAYYYSAGNSTTYAPSITFRQAGYYNIQLSLSNICGPIFKNKRVSVIGATTVTLPAARSYCDVQTINFGTNVNHKPTYSSAAGNEVYNWTITSVPSSASYSFTGGTTAASAYPQISFSGYAVYTVKLTFQNSCSIASTTQTITINQPVTANAGPDSTVCYNVGSIPLTGIATGPSSGVKWTISGAGNGTFGNSSMANTTYNFGSTDLTNLTVKLMFTNTATTPTACSNVSSTRTITILPRNSTTNATATVCSGTTLAYTPTSSTAGSTFTWTALVTAGSVTGVTASGSGNITDKPINSSNSTDGTVVYTITPKIGNCNGDIYTYTVTVKPLPLLTIAKPDTICSGAKTLYVLTSTIAGTAYKWTASLLSGSATGYSSNTASFAAWADQTLTNNGTLNSKVQYVFTPSVTATGCAGSPVTVTTVVRPTTTPANAGRDTTLCNQSTYKLQATQLTVGKGTWTQVSGPSVSFANATLYNTTVTLPNNQTTSNTFVLKWSVTDSVGGGCQASSAQVTITNRPAITTATANNVIICDLTSTTNNNTVLTGNLDATRAYENGLWTITSQPVASTVSFSDATKPNATFNFNQSGVYKLTWTITNDVPSTGPNVGCNISSVNITVTVFDAPTKPVLKATPNELCNDGSSSNVTIINSYTGQIVKWQYKMKPASNNAWVDVNNTNTSNSFTKTDTFAVRVIVQSLGASQGCNTQVISDSVVINVAPQTLPGITSGTKTVCGGANNGNVILTGNVGSVIKWQSSQDNGATWQDITNTTTTYNYVNIITTTIYRAVVQSGACSNSASQPTTITVVPGVTASAAGPDQYLCNATNTSLQGNTPVTGIGGWSQVGGPGVSFVNAASPTTGISGLVADNVYTFVWTIVSTGGCPSSTDTVIIYNRPTVTPANAGSNVNVCSYTAVSPGTVNLHANKNSARAYETTTWTVISQPTGSTAVFSNPNDPNAVFTYNAIGTYQLRWTIANDACPASTKDILINVYPKPISGVPAPSFAITCYGTDVIVNESSYIGTIKKWQVNPAPTNDGIWIDSLVTTPYITLRNLTDTMNVRVIISSGDETNCPQYDTSAISTIAVSPLSVGGTTSSNATVCQGINAGTINLTGQVGKVIRWEYSIDNGNSWIVINNTTTSLNYSNVTTTTLYRAVVQSGVCAPANSAYTTITIVPQATVANAGPDQMLCNAASVTLAGNTISNGTGTWTQIAGPPAAITNQNAPNTTITGLIGGNTYTFKWTVTGLANCPQSSSTVNIVNRPAMTQANAGPAQTVCDFTLSTNNTAQLAGNIDATRPFEKGTWAIVSQPGGATGFFTSNDIHNPNAIFNFNKSGTYVLRWTITNDNNCTPTTSDVQITVYDAPYPATVTANPMVTCIGSTVTATASGYTGVIQKWQYNPKPINDNIWIDIPDNNSTHIFTNVQDTFAVRVVIQSAGAGAGCNTTVLSNEVAINVNPVTVKGNVTGTATVCIGTNSGTLNLVNNIGAVIKWQYSTDNGSSWFDIANTTTSQSYSNVTTTTLYRAMVQSGQCPADYSTPATLTVVPQVTPANAGANATLCNQTNYTLTGNVPVSGTGTWTQTGGPAANILTPSSATTTITGLTGGNVYQFTWTITGLGNCAPSSSTVTITNRPDPTPANAGPSQKVCDYVSGNIKITLAGNLNPTRPYETGKWVIINQPVGAATYFTGNNNTIPNAEFNLNRSGTYELQWQITNDNNCTPSTNNMIINVYDAPTKATVAASPTLTCVGGDVTAGATNYSGVIVKWQYNPAPVTDGLWIDINDTNASYTFSNVQTTFALRVVTGSAGAGSGCNTQIVSDSVVITVTPGAVGGNTSGSTTVCTGTNSGNIQLNNNFGNIVRWEYSTNNGITWNIINNTTATVAYNNLTSTRWYRAWVVNGICPPLPSDTAVITVVPPVTPADAGVNQSLCNQTTTNIVGNIPLSGNGMWTQTGGPAVSIANPASPSTTVSGMLGNNIYKFTWTISSAGGCAGSSAEMTVTNRPAVTQSSVLTPVTVCDFTSTTNNSITLSGNLNGSRPYESGQWSIISQPPGSSINFSDLSSPSSTFSFTRSGTYDVRWTISNDLGCAPTYSDEIINVYDKPTPASVAVNPVLTCIGSNVTANATNYTGVIAKWQINPAPFNDSIWIDVADNNPLHTFTNVQDSFLVRVVTSSGNAACINTAVSGYVEVDVTPLSVGGTTSGTATVCLGTNAGNIQLNNYVGKIVKWQYSTDNGNSWFDYNTNASSIPYLNITATTWYRAMVQSGICNAVYSDIAKLTVVPQVTPSNAGPDQKLCNQTNVTLAANTPLSGTGIWTQTGGPAANITNFNAPNTTVTGLSTGNVYQFTWTITGLGNCAPSSSAVNVTIMPQITTSVAGNDITVCDFTSTTNNNIQLSGNFDPTRSAFEFGQWYIISQPAGSVANFDVATKPNAILTFSKAGTYKLMWSISNGGSCPASQSYMNVNVYDAPTKATVNASPLLLCAGGNVTAAASGYNGIIQKWQINPAPLSSNIWVDVNDNNATHTFSNVQDTFAVRVITMSAGSSCTSTAISDPVTIYVTPATIPGTTSGSATVCVGTNTGQITLNGNNGTILKWQYSTNNGISWFDIVTNSNTIPYNNVTTTTWYRALVQSGVCTSAYSDVAILTVVPQVTPSNAGPNQKLCNQNTVTLAGNTPSSGAGMWTQAGGPAVLINNPSLPNTTVTGLTGNNTYQFTWTITGLGNCAPSSSSVTIINRPAVTIATTGGNQTICDYTTGNVQINLTGNLDATRPYETGQWVIISQPVGAATYFTGNNNTVPNAQFNLNKSGTYQLQWQITNDNGCAPSIAGMTINVYDLPTKAVVNASPMQLCAGGSVTAGATNYSGVIQKWQINPVPLNDGIWIDVNDNNATHVFNNVQDTFAVRVITVSAGAGAGCTSVAISDSVVISVNPVTNAGVISGDATVCVGTNSGQITLNGYTGNILKWQYTTNGGISWFDIASTSNAVPYNNITVTTWYRALVQSGVCAPAYSNNAILTVVPQVTPSNAGPNQQLCNQLNATLAGNTPASGTGMWTQTGGPAATILTPASPTSGITGLVAGNTYQFTWTITGLGNCAPSSSSTTIINRPQITTSVAGNDITVCDFTSTTNTSVTLSGNFDPTRSSFESGQWIIISQPPGSAANFNDASKPNAIITYTKAGAYKLRWTISNGGGCPPSTSDMTVNVYDLPTSAVVSASPTLVCAGGTVTAGATGFNGVISKWQINPVPFNDNIWIDVNDNSSTHVFNNVTDSFLVRVVTVSSGAGQGCTSSAISNAVEVDVTPTTIGGNTTGSATVCIGTNNGVIGLTGYVGNIQKWQYSTNGGISWFDIVTSANNIPYNNVTATTWYRALVLSGVCNPAYSDIAILTVVPQVTPSVAGPNQQLCAQTTATLAGNTPVSGTGTWTQTGGPAVNITNPLNPSTTVTGLVGNNTYQFTWTITGLGNCQPSSSSVNIINRPSITIANAGPDIQVCDFTATTNTSVTLSGNFDPTRSSFELGQWIIISQPPGSAANFNDASKPNAVITYTKAGAYKLRWTISNGGGCPPSTSDMTVNVYDLPTIAMVAASPTLLCAGGDVTAVASGFNGVISKWQINMAPLSNNVWIDVLDNSSTHIFSNVQDTFQIRVVTISAGSAQGCTSSVTSAPVTINVTPPTNRGQTTGTATVCVGTNAGQVQLNGYLGNIIKWQYTNNGGISWYDIYNTTNAIPYSNLTTTTWYRALVQSGVCAALYSDTAVLTVVPQVTPSNAGPDQQLCNQSTLTLVGNIPASGTGMWTQTGGPTAVITNPTLPTTTVTGLTGNNNYQFTWTITGLGNCQPSSSAVNIINRPSITVANAGADVNVCDFTTSTNNSIILNGNIDPSRTYESGQWAIVSQPPGSTAYFGDATKPNSSFNFNKSGAYVLMWKISNGNGCPPSTSNVTINVFDKPTAPMLTASPMTTCAGADVTASATGFIGTVSKWQYNPRPINDGIWIDVPDNNASHIFSNVQDTFALRVVIVSAGAAQGCSTTIVSDSLVINVAPNTIRGNTSGSTSVCKGSNSGGIQLNGYVGTIRKWQYSTDNGASWYDITSASNAVPYNNLTTTTWYRAWVQSGVCNLLYSDTAVVTVLNRVTQAYAGATQQLCNQSTTQLAGNVPGVNEIGTWTQVAGPVSVVLNNANASTTTISGLLPGTYKFEWRLKNNVCADTQDTVTIVNYEALQNNIALNNMVVCAGVPVVITGSPATGGSGSYVYQWQQSVDSINWVNVSAANSTNLSFIANDTVYLRRMVSSTPCSNVSGVVKITVQKPIMNNTVGTDQSICINAQPALLTGSTPGGADGNYVYQWQQSVDGFNWTDISFATGKNYQPDVLTQIVQYRRLVRSNLCFGQQQSVSNVVTVTVNPNAKAQVNVTKTIDCAPFNINTAIIQATRFDAGNGSYEWFVDNTSIGTGVDFPGYTHTAANDSFVVKLRAVSLFGCKNDSVSVKFYTVPKPASSFKASDTVGCGPLSVTFTNTTPKNDLYQYQWNLGNGQIVNQYNVPTIIYTQALGAVDTVYTVTLSTYTHCDTSVAVQKIRVQSRPKAIFIPSKQNACSPANITFSNNSIAGQAVYDWDFGDGTTTTRNDKSAVQHIFSTQVSATFNVKLKVTNGCGVDSMVFPINVDPNNMLLQYKVDGLITGCAPYTVKLVNNSIGGDNYSWDFGDGTVVSRNSGIDTLIHTYYATGTYQIQLSTKNGCGDTSAVRTVYVNHRPVVNFTAQPASTCVGDTIHFTNLTDSATSIAWSFGDGITGSQFNAVHSYDNGGSYTVRMQATAVYSNGGVCIDSASKQVTIIAGLPGAFTVTDSVGKCTPFIVTFTNLNVPSALTTWDFGDNKKDTGDVITHSFNNVGTFVVKMNAQSNGGCKYSAQKVINVSGPSGTLTYDKGNVCGPKLVRFEVNMQSTDSVRWIFGDGTFQVTTGNVVYHTYNQAGNYLPSAQLLAGTSCAVLLPGLDTIKVDYVKAGFIAIQQNFCGTSRATFSDTSRSYFGVKNYLWDFGDGVTSTDKNPQHDYTITNTWMTKLVIETNTGCRDTAVFALYARMGIKPQAVIQSDTVACLNELMTFAGVASSVDPVNYYQWNFSNNIKSTQIITSTTFAIAGPQTARLIIGTTMGCYDTTTKVININPNPFVHTNQDMTICKGQSTQLVASGALTYSWSPLETLSCNTCAAPVAYPTNNTTYVVTGFNQYGCYGSDTVLISVNQPFKLAVSPNDTICIGGSSRLTAENAAIYAWTPTTGVAAPTAASTPVTPTVTTRYRVIGADAMNCFRDTAYVTVAVGQYPTVNLGPDQQLATGTLLPLKATYTNGPIYTWQWTGKDLSCTDCPEPIAEVKKDACYYLTATNQYKCSGSDTICVKAFCESAQIFIPNAFTPDNDGMNDILMVRGKGIKEIKLFRIFNRWGQVVFERAHFQPNDKSSAWDGKINGVAATPDVYVYMCDVVCENDVAYTYKGNVAILK